MATTRSFYCTNRSLIAKQYHQNINSKLNYINHKILQCSNLARTRVKKNAVNLKTIKQASTITPISMKFPTVTVLCNIIHVLSQWFKGYDGYGAPEI